MKIQALSAIVVLSLTGAFATGAHAATRNVTLDVPGMTCAVCPITVKKALMKVSGVTDAKVNYESKAAIVEYDDTATNPEALMKATANAGYPSTVRASR